MATANPRKIPRTQQDVDRAEQKGYQFGHYFSTVVFLWILANKHEINEEDLQTVFREFHDSCEAITKGYATLADYAHTLKEEFGIVIEK